MDIWDMLGIVALAILLVFLFKRKNAVTVAFAIGVLVALIAGLIYYFKGDGFNWILAKKMLILSILVGGVYRLVSYISNKTKSEAG
jgi:uncharacterized membrane protein YfcA